ncbi:DUF1427 family protein [Silvibacterium sp.]|uniref:DUF1427 family protein n=1 Tax=Silvibacterium sp. TaxID=1964179 RepID=UPI0039E42C0C
MRLVAGFLLAFGIGIFCRLCRIPSPAPQAIIGSLLVVAMSVGFVAADRFVERLSGNQVAQQPFHSNQEDAHARN